ncbi:MAG: VCBS repeat-containing protein, partial [Bifidobacteriaceae bacterium]|nr:VCBS repeat-containing protein [Bifidobacteriaceae bacterium]
TKTGYTTATATASPQTVAPAAMVAGESLLGGDTVPGATLTADAEGWVPADVQLAYQWYLDDQPISGAVTSSYVIKGTDAGHGIFVVITGVKQGYATTSAPPIGVQIDFGTITPGSADIVGLPKVGQTIGAATGAWTPSDVELTYQWQADGVDIEGATGATYTVQGADSGKALTVVVTGEKDGYNTATATSPAYLAEPGTVVPGGVTISGTAKAGLTVTAVASGWQPTSGLQYTYQWAANSVVVPGATAATYTIQAADAGKNLTVTVTGVASGYEAASATSAPVKVSEEVAPPEPENYYESFSLAPDLSGDKRGEVLGVTASGGALHMYTTTSAGRLDRLVTLSSSGLTGHRVYGVPDWNGDGKADVLSIDAAGAMWLYAGNGASKLAAAVQCGRGWSAYQVVPSTDLNGDKAADLLAVDSAGTLWLYAGNGKGGFLSGRTEVGHGWTGFKLYAAGDVNNDGKADILGVNSAGALYLYLGKGNGQFQAPQQVGRGWNAFTLAAGADLDGDGLADIVGRSDSTGALYFYKSKGSGQFAAGVVIDSGW